MPPSNRQKPLPDRPLLRFFERFLENFYGTKAIFFSLVLFFCVFSACQRENSYALVHEIVNESSATVTFEFGPDRPQNFRDSIFVLAPSERDTVILYEDTGDAIPIPNCGILANYNVEVSGGQSFSASLADVERWDSNIDQANQVSSCRFVILESDIE